MYVRRFLVGVWLTFRRCLLQKLVTCVLQALYTFVLFPPLWYDVLIFRIAPYIPPIDPTNASDTQNFDDTFLDMEPVINDENDMDTDQERECTDQEPTDGGGSVATPSQLRSSSAHPPNDLVDVFDGYSFKGRHSVIVDNEGDVSEEEEDVPGDKDDEDQNITGRSIVATLNGTVVTEAAVTTVHEEPTREPKTPEARSAALPPSTPLAKRGPLVRRPELPPIDTTINPASVADVTPRASGGTTTSVFRARMIPVKAVAGPAADASTGPDIHHKEPKGVPASEWQGRRSNRQRTRREKSGIPALDRDLSDANDEDEVRTVRNEENEGWDLIEADGGGGEERYGPRGNSLFARGVVDRYRLSVFRKGSTPNRASSGVPGEAAGPSAGPNSPSPTIKENRRGTGTLPFRRTPKALLRTKSPPSTPTRSSKSPGN